mmetsp:Transcript_45208/g.105419  ORF Transcript_45208/g.105419 Transcript_45208/m.105419 type:complete len:407 (+) Transcript_45208:908-2128(+)
MVHLWCNRGEEGIQLHWLFVQVELHSPVVELHVGDLLHDHQELIVGKGHRAVSHHGVGGLVKLIVVSVEENSMLPVVMPLACVDKLRNVQLLNIHLDEIHKHLWLVLRIHRGQLGVHTNMGTFVAKSCLQQLHQSIKAALLLVLRDHFFQVVWMDDDVLSGDLCTSELLCLHAGQVDLLPRFGVVGLLRRLNCLGVLSELNMAGGQAPVVRDRSVQDLGGLVELLIVETVANCLDVGGVGAANELLHLAQTLCLCVSIDQFTVNLRILDLCAGHHQVSNQLLIVLLPLSCLDHLQVVCGILRFEVRVHGLGHAAILQLRLAQLVPNRLVVDARGKLLPSLEGVDVLEQHIHGLCILPALLVDDEGLLVQAIRIAKRNLRNLGAVVVVQAVDVVHDAILVRLDCCED